MLVLNFKKGERAVLCHPYGPLFVKVLKTGKTIRLGFEAPPEVPVHRESVYRRILAESQPKNPGNPEPNEGVD